MSNSIEPIKVDLKTLIELKTKHRYSNKRIGEVTGMTTAAVTKLYKSHPQLKELRAGKTGKSMVVQIVEDASEVGENTLTINHEAPQRVKRTRKKKGEVEAPIVPVPAPVAEAPVAPAVEAPVTETVIDEGEVQEW